MGPAAADAPVASGEGAMESAVVVFLHVEERDVAEESRAGVLRKTCKHVKWIAGKESFRNVVLHSFTHLGGETAPPDAAAAFMAEVRTRLESVGYEKPSPIQAQTIPHLLEGRDLIGQAQLLIDLQCYPN